ncbi:MAG TPA: hypothetical protein VN112_19095, partial [Ensifer sp.]|nr:hypothetical protein [Ensifer sp.]
LVGGVLVMMVTQYVAIPVGAPEIFPATAAVFCTQQQKTDKTCVADTGSGAANQSQDERLALLLGYCATLPADAPPDVGSLCKMVSRPGEATGNTGQHGEEINNGNTRK